jgi:ubiquinone/menaquinone biosynthesis C-methylase UbiE
VPDYERYDYSKRWRHLELANAAERETIRRMLWTSGRCLELGGGYGRITSLLEEIYDEIQMMDMSQLNLQIAQAGLDRVKLLRGDIRRIPFRNDTFDCVVCVRVLHHYPDPLPILQEISRVVRRRGQVLLGVPNDKSIHNRLFNGAVKTWIDQHGHVISNLGSRAIKGIPLIETMRKGTGLFDNNMGRALRRLRPLSYLDVYSSGMLALKSMVFISYRNEKSKDNVD